MKSHTELFFFRCSPDFRVPLSRVGEPLRLFLVPPRCALIVAPASLLVLVEQLAGLVESSLSPLPLGIPASSAGPVAGTLLFLPPLPFAPA